MEIKTEIDEILESLKRIRKAKPYVGYKEYWEEVRKAIEEENRIFAEEDRKLELSNENIDRYFII